MSERHGKKPGGIRQLITLVTLALAAAAVVKELRKDPDDRTWNGTVGFVPYEFRIPTLERVRERLWDPDGERLIGPRVFGVGWTVNVGRVVALVRQRVAESRAEEHAAD
ncbi:hypothetical protein GCM10009809_19470 [Isoptericola hypogeus]|uniref:DUF5808 domain-containing protein n=1 Tax=Isoptericola hypogeus TaxID=300179 RepID=A0ABP4VE29_9MICO